ALVEPAWLNAAGIAVIAGVTRPGGFAGVHRARPPLPLAWPATCPMASRPGQYARAHGHVVMTRFPDSLRVLDKGCAFSAPNRALSADARPVPLLPAHLQ